MSIFKVPQLAWYKPKELPLRLKDDWQVKFYRMAGNNRPTLKGYELRNSIKHPIEMPPLREYAKGRKQVAIIFDDMSRVTRVKEIVPYVLEELAEAGVPENNIRFIMALGAHAAKDRRDFVKKLGDSVLRTFPVYNHNPFANCVYVGTTTTFGTKVYINEEVMKCDLKIAIGSVVPHPMTGFGGGGKIMLPGVASLESIQYNHKVYYETIRPQGLSVSGMGVINEKNTLCADIEEAALLAGLDMLINCIVNEWGQTVAVYAGALKPTFDAALKEAKQNYLTPSATNKDIVIVNSFAKANEAFIGLRIAYPALKPKNGDIVLVANAPEGQVTHYLLGPFGETSWGPLRQLPQMPSNINRVIVFSAYPDLSASSWFEDSDRVVFVRKWHDVIQLLEEDHVKSSQVAIYPSADIQYTTL